jgi:hypothetical protein
VSGKQRGSTIPKGWCLRARTPSAHQCAMTDAIFTRPFAPSAIP